MHCLGAQKHNDSHVETHDQWWTSQFVWEWTDYSHICPTPVEETDSVSVITLIGDAHLLFHSKASSKTISISLQPWEISWRDLLKDHVKNAHLGSASVTLSPQYAIHTAPSGWEDSNHGLHYLAVKFPVNHQPKWCICYSKDSPISSGNTIWNI